MDVTASAPRDSTAEPGAAEPVTSQPMHGPCGALLPHEPPSPELCPASPAHPISPPDALLAPAAAEASEPAAPAPPSAAAAAAEAVALPSVPAATGSAPEEAPAAAPAGAMEAGGAGPAAAQAGPRATSEGGGAYGTLIVLGYREALMDHDNNVVCSAGAACCGQGPTSGPVRQCLATEPPRPTPPFL